MGVKFPNFTLIPLIFCFVLGLLFSFHLETNILYFSYSSLLFLCVIGLFLRWWLRDKNFLFFPVLLCTLSFSIGVKTCMQSHEISQNHYIFSYSTQSHNNFQIELTDRLHPTKNHNRYYGKVFEINSKKTSWKVLILHEKKDSLKIELGEFVKTTTPLIPMQKPKNIGSFDYKRFLSNIGILHQLKLRGSSFSTSSGISISSLFNKFKQNTINKVEKSIFVEETKKLILALILGERSDVNRAWMDR
ncbi:MAG: hypothetical protein CMP52_05005 [Flavobacteriales bacterium]|nr:hypothetical protein [Candidatus Arcticimaribacter sp.]